MHYSSDWTDDNDILPDFFNHVPIDTNIADIAFTSFNVLKQLKNLKGNSSAGAFLEANFVPNGWFTAHVKPLFKRQYVLTAIITNLFHQLVFYVRSRSI